MISKRQVSVEWAPTHEVLVDGATNRITTAGHSYDANGNQTAQPGPGESTVFTYGRGGQPEVALW